MNYILPDTEEDNINTVHYCWNYLCSMLAPNVENICVACWH